MSAHTRRWGRTLGLLPVIVMIAGCTPGDAPGPTAAPSPTAASSTTAATESPSPDLSPTVRPSSGRPVQQISGTVAAGVEAGCLLLDSGGDQDWLLLGDTTGLEPGRRATVEGRPDPETVTTCQQGRPFRVSRVL